MGKFNDYIKNVVLRSECSYKAPGDRPIHGMLGIFSEFGELHRSTDNVNMVEEIGDILFYVGILADHFNFADIIDEVIEAPRVPVSPAQKLNFDTSGIVNESGDMAGVLKTTIYGLDCNVCQLAEYTTNLVLELCCLLDYISVDVSAALDANGRKLAKRYPEKFAVDKHLTRDLDTERKALEGE